VYYLEEIHKKLQENLPKVQIQMEKVQNNNNSCQKYLKYNQQHPDFKIMDKVLKDTRKIET
jgi:hypothetical protein